MFSRDKMLLLILLFMLCRASAVIYQMNETEFSRMPPVFQLEPYNSCVQEKGGTYCTVDINLVSDNDSSLLNMIKEYSERKESHMNHSLLLHGVCVTKSCKDYVNVRNYNGTVDLRQAIESCMNHTFWNDYKLKTRIGEYICNDKESKMVLEPADIAVAVMVLFLILMNIAGSLYHILVIKEDDIKGPRWLLCFSIRHNWRKLIAPSTSDDWRVQRLKCLSGIRALAIAMVITEHSLYPFVITADNVLLIETAYLKISYHLILNGTLLVQTFFIISGCLLAYHLQIYSEKAKITWIMIPKTIMIRWLRLTPSYAVMLAITATWLRFAGSGPLWHAIVYTETTNCRKYGWQNLLYINNMFGDPLCIPPAWYLAADMQLFILGIILLVLLKSNRARKVALSVMFVVSILIVTFHTYFQDLQAHLLISPQVVRERFINDPTFNHSYKKADTNLSCFVMGIATGLLIYELQQKNFNVEKYKKYKYLFWAVLPVSVALILCCGLLYMYEEPSPLIARAFFSGIFRSSFGIMALILILGIVFKIENVYRPLFEWQGWRSPARVSYSAYILHLLIIEIIIGARTTLTSVTLPEIILTCVGITFTTFLLAYPFWLLVEAPLTQLVKVLMFSEEKDTDEPKLDIEKTDGLRPEINVISLQ